MKHLEENNHMLSFALLSGTGSMSHFVTTRQGGVSKGEYSSFNLGEFAGDERENVAENRNRLGNLLRTAVDKLVFPHQTHGSEILCVDAAFIALPPVEQAAASHGFDAVVTKLTDVCIGVTTADCVPLLAFDPVRKVLAAIHAGWRGTVAHIVPKTIRFMAQKYDCHPADILLGIGPAISQARFEVGEEVANAFSHAGIDLINKAFRHHQSGKMHIDLQAVNHQLATDAGILPSHIETMQLCTYERADLFFSARRQGTASGRMVTGGFIRR